MHVTLSKLCAIVGLTVAAPILSAQILPFGLRPPDKTKISDVSSFKRPSKDGGAEGAAFKGQYVVAIHGAAVGGAIVSREIAAVGRIEADGRGNITGVMNIDSAFGAAHAPIAGTYALNGDGTGTLSWTVTPTDIETFEFFVSLDEGKVKSATLLESDGNGGTSGTVVRQQSTDAPEGSYHFNLIGETFVTSGVPDAVAAAGTLNINQGLVQGTVGLFVSDVAQNSATSIPPVAFQARMSAPDQTGRFVLTFMFPAEVASPEEVHFVGYVVDSKQFILLPMDSPSPTRPIISGSGIQ